MLLPLLESETSVEANCAVSRVPAASSWIAGVSAFAFAVGHYVALLNGLNEQVRNRK